MVSPLSEMVIAKGVANVDFSKLTPQLRSQVCDEVGEALMKRGNHEEAARALALIASPKLRELSNYFLTHGLPGAAAAYALHVDDKPFVSKVAFSNLHTGNVEQAKRLFSRAGDYEMVKFIEENF
jgi:hypothetical protein